MPPVGYRHVIVKALARPGTRQDIEERSGMLQSTVVRWLRILRNERLVHIVKWTSPRRQGNHSPVYALGSGQDAPKPERDSWAVTSKRYRTSIEGTERGDQRLARRRAHYFRTKAEKQGDKMINRLFGKGPAATKEES